MAPSAIVMQPEPLECLLEHCIAARAVIDESGSSVMRALIDVLLFEVGIALAARSGPDNASEGVD